MQAMIKARNVKKKGRPGKKPERPILSAFLNEVRTFSSRISACRQKNLIRKCDSCSWDTGYIDLPGGFVP
jgi:hypothetical protein